MTDKEKFINFLNELQIEYEDKGDFIRITDVVPNDMLAADLFLDVVFKMTGKFISFVVV